MKMICLLHQIILEMIGNVIESWQQAIIFYKTVQLGNKMKESNTNKLQQKSQKH